MVKDAIRRDQLNIKRRPVSLYIAFVASFIVLGAEKIFLLRLFLLNIGLYSSLIAGFRGPTCEETNHTLTTEGPPPPTQDSCPADEDSCLGHFTCDSATGVITCLTGFKGDFCTERDFDGKFLRCYMCVYV